MKNFNALSLHRLELCNYENLNENITMGKRLNKKTYDFDITLFIYFLRNFCIHRYTILSFYLFLVNYPMMEVKVNVEYW